MIYLLLTSELPWQRNDAITFLTCLCIWSSCLPYGKVLNNFYESVLERSLRVIKTVNNHAIDIIGQSSHLVAFSSVVTADIIIKSFMCELTLSCLLKFAEIN